MKLHNSVYLIISLSWFLAQQSSYAEEEKKGIEEYVITVDGKQFVPVSRITSEQLNKQFMNGIKMLRKQREMLAAFEQKLSEVTEPAERKTVQMRRDDLGKRLEDNNRYLIDRFRYSMNRNFMIIVEDSHIYRLTSEEEIEQLKANYPDQDWNASIRRDKDRIFILAKVIEGEEENKTFQQYTEAVRVQVAEKQKNETIMDQILQRTSIEYKDSSKREKFINWYYELDDSIKNNEAYLHEHYQVTVQSGFVRVIINSKLYVEVTSGELARLPVEGASVLY